MIAGLLRRLWRAPSAPHPFRPLAEMIEHWSAETLAQEHLWPDAGLVREGLRLFCELSRSAPGDVLLATDLHAGNVLRAQREPWLMIDADKRRRNQKKEEAEATLTEPAVPTPDSVK